MKIRSKKLPYAPLDKKGDMKMKIEKEANFNMIWWWLFLLNEVIITYIIIFFLYLKYESRDKSNNKLRNDDIS